MIDIESGGKVPAAAKGQPSATKLPLPTYFENPTIRNGFVQKVYGLLAVMLALTLGIILACMLINPVNEFLKAHLWVFVASSLTDLTLAILLACCPFMGRTFPLNYICLFGITISTAFMCATACVYFELSAVLIAVGITFGIVLLVSLFSCWTEFDFTRWYWIAFMLSISLTFSGVILIAWPSHLGQIIYGFFGVVVMIIYLAIDTQLIMGGRAYQFSPEDYVFATLSLYLDIINLFIFILQLLGSSSNN